MYDVIIVGGGVSGTAVARELSRYKVNVCLIEKEEDVCSGTSKANSAIAHAGYDAKEGSLMAKLNVEGSKMMEELSKELDFAFEKNGSMVICLCEEDMPNLQALYDRGIKNGVKDLKILDKEEAMSLEPNLTDDFYAALYAPNAGIVCPFSMNVAFAENAAVNGVEFKFDTEVKDILKKDGYFEIITNNSTYQTKVVVNAAGVYADELHNMVSDKKINIVARRGDYFLLDKNVGQHVKHTIFALPGKYGKGVLVAPTVHGNLIVGPTAIDVDDKDGVNTTADGLNQIIEKAGRNVKNLPLRQVITSFSGLRAHEDGHEFIIGEVEDAEGFIDCAGIESPGLTSCPAIGKMVAGIIRDKLKLENKDNFVSKRKGFIHIDKLTFEEKKKLIEEKPEYAHIICRCESVSEGEIIDAINRPVGAKSLDGIKRRVRAGSGRCQGGFCTPKVMEIIARELNMDIKDVTKKGKNSNIIVGVNKDTF